MEAALKPDAGSPPDLNLAFLCEKWGPQAVLGPSPDVFTLFQFSYLISVYRVFSKSRTVQGSKSLTQDERELQKHVMLLKVELDHG